MSLKRKIQIGLVLLLGVFIASAGFTLNIVERQLGALNTVSGISDKVDSVYTKLANNAQTMQYNIVQVQQFLSDLGATRGLISQKDTDEDYKDAEENTQSFLKMAADSRALAVQIDEKELVAQLDEVATAFPAYYETGKAMAQAYMANGAEAGNKLMPKFDAASDKLQDPMTKIQTRSTELYTQAATQNSQLIGQVKDGAAGLAKLTALADIVVLLFLIGAAVFLIMGVIGPVGRFSAGIRAIARGNLEEKVVGEARADEIGEMARALARLKLDLGETFKLKEMLETMPYNVMLADPKQDFKITFCNRSSLENFKKIERWLPCKAAQIVGSSFDIFHKNPAHQRKMLADPKNLPHTTKFRIGPETVSLTVSAIYDKSGAYLGPMATWSIVTADVERAEAFEKNVKGVVEIVGATAQNVNASARSLAGSTEQLAQQAAAGATQAEQTSSNVHTVAAAAEELSASISEITQQVGEASRIAQAASSEAGATNAHVRSLGEATQKIGDVVKLVSEIAGQTNLLALNATIEAARAGEAGKGFAVVASEVKNLANQTAKATEEISQQISHLQGVTQMAITGITSITQTIERINQIQGAIASAVDQQNAATREISHNVQDASQGTVEVSQTIGEVTRVSQDTGSAAGSLLGSSEELIQKAEILRTEVDKFMNSIRA